jgi:hypothetical protein
MYRSNIPLCEMDFDNLFCKYEVTYFSTTEILWGDEVPAYIAGIIYGPSGSEHWDQPIESLAGQLGDRLTINYIPT